MKDKAKYIPRLPKLRCSIFLMTMILLNFSILATTCTAGRQVFHARIDIKYSDGQIKKSNFIMIPAENDFRAANFTLVFITGTADFSHNIPGISSETQAKHNAVKRLLEQRGLKSIKTRTTNVNGLQHNEIIMSYEGAVKLPLTVIKKKIDKQKHLCTIALKIEFAPTAFPDKWSMLQLKYKMRQLINHFILLFK